MTAKAVYGAVIEAPSDDTATRTVFHDQVEREVLDKKFGMMAQALLVERVDDRVPRPVGGGAGAPGRIAFAVIAHMAAEGPLVDPPVLGARKWHAEMLELDDGRDRIAAHVLDRVLVAEPFGTLEASYMYHCQVSSDMLARAAAMPPCAATVWLRVGNTFVMQAVLRPPAAIPMVARSPAPPAPTTTTS